MRRVEGGQRLLQHDVEDGQPQQSGTLREGRGRVEQGVERQRNRHDGREHERVPAAEARAGAIGPAADDGIGDGIDGKARGDRQPDLVGGQAADLIIIKQQELGDRGDHDRFRHAAHAVEDLETPGQRGRHLDIAAQLSHSPPPCKSLGGSK